MNGITTAFILVNLLIHIGKSKNFGLMLRHEKLDLKTESDNVLSFFSIS